MNSKDNLVKHPEVDEEEEIVIDPDELDGTFDPDDGDDSGSRRSRSSDSAAKSKMFKFMGIILIITLLFLFIKSFILNSSQ